MFTSDKIHMNNLYEKYNSVSSLDSTKLDQLKDLGKDIDEDVLGQLMKVHRETSAIILKEMKLLCNHKNFPELKRCTHKFKSSSANLGLLRLNKLCADLEIRLAHEIELNLFDLPLIQEYVECISIESGESDQQLNAYLKVG